LGWPPPDPKDAVIWYGKAAKVNNACGQFGLAALYQSGTGVTADPAQAAILFAAAAQGFTQDGSSFLPQQLQQHFYAAAYKLTGQTQWVDLVSTAVGGGGGRIGPAGPTPPLPRRRRR
jgi:TPR repeat protein